MDSSNQELIKPRKHINYVLTHREIETLDTQIKKLNLIKNEVDICCKSYGNDVFKNFELLKEKTHSILIILGNLTIKDLWINKRHEDFYYYVDNVKDYAWEIFEIIDARINGTNR
jgi:hypothetical protein